MPSVGGEKGMRGSGAAAEREHIVLETVELEADEGVEDAND